MDYIAWLSLGITIIALAFSVQAMRANTAAMQQANKIKEQENILKSKEIRTKEQENALKYLYDRRALLRDKLVWLTQFVHNDIENCRKRIDSGRHPYKLIDPSSEGAAGSAGDYFRHTILSELYWLHNEIQILFPSVVDKYRRYCDLIGDANAKSRSHEEYASAKTMKEAGVLLKEIIGAEMPRVMRDDFERELSSGLTTNTLEVAGKERQV